MLSIDVQISGDKAAIKKLEAISHNIKDLRGPLSLVGKALKFYFANESFASQGGAIGTKWPKLADSTVRYKRKHYPQYAATPLIRTGKMQKSFTYKSQRDGLVISNTAPQFKYHQSSAPRHKIPYRPMMAASSPVVAIVKTIIEKEIQTMVRAL